MTYLRDCPCLSSDNTNTNGPSQHNKHLLVIRSQEADVSPGYASMDFSQTIEVSQVEDDTSNKVFLIALTRIDFKGYAYLSNNSDQTLAFVS